MQAHVSYKYPAIFLIVGGLIIIIMMIGASFDDNEVFGTELSQVTPTAVAQEPTATDTPPTQASTATPMPPTATPLPTELPTSTPEPTELPAPTEAASDEGDASTGDTASTDYPADVVALGETLYAGTCSACHGADGRGLPNLGKDLVDSEFVHSQTDEELVDFIITGRPIWDPENTTSIDMPPRGGNPMLTEEDIYAIVVYLRTLDSGNSASIEGSTDTSIAADESTDSVTQIASAEFDPTLADEGSMVFAGACAACHGPEARGIPGLGKDLVESEFVHGLSNEELVEFVTTGRPIWDAANTTGIDMPPRGGNPALTDAQIMAVIHYLRSLEE